MPKKWSFRTEQMRMSFEKSQVDGTPAAWDYEEENLQVVDSC